MLASSTGDEAAGNEDYQRGHMGKIFAEGFSFSGFERDKLYLNQGGAYVDISGLSGLDSVWGTAAVPPGLSSTMTETTTYC